MKIFTSFIIFFFFLTTTGFSQAKITTRFCLTGEYVELTAEVAPRFNRFTWNTGQTGRSIIVPAEALTKTYSFTATCPKRCKKTKSIIISKNDFTPKPPTAKITAVSCHDTKDGAIQLSIYGGIGPLHYEWSDGATTKNRNDLSGGTYSVTINDREGCSQSLTVEVVEPAELAASEISVATKDATCFNTATGAIKITSTKYALTNYEFAWSNGADSTELTGLPAATYNVFIRRDTFCRAEQIKVGQPAELSPNLTIASDYHGFAVSCPDKKDGQIAIHITGGTAPYRLTWKQPKRSTFSNLQDTTLLFSDLTASTFIAIVHDKNGCRVEQNKTLKAPTPIQTTVTVSQYGDYNISCRKAKDGQITLTPSGGAGQYTYSWTQKKDTIGTTAQLSALDGGKYKVVITDGNNCLFTQTIKLKEPQVVDATHTIIKEQEDQVTIRITPQGGTGLFLDDEGATVRNNYLMTVKRTSKEPIYIVDSNNCTHQKNWTFPKPIDPTAIYGDGEVATTSKAKPYRGRCPKF